MMEKVRAAVFSMIQAQLGGVSSLPSSMRWLDLFAGGCAHVLTHARHDRLLACVLLYHSLSDLVHLHTCM